MKNICRILSSVLPCSCRWLTVGLSFVVLAACFSCKGEDEWQPGPAVAEGTPVVYFSSENPATIVNRGEDQAKFNLILERLNTEGELTVPIVVNSKQGEMDIPSSVTFKDGENWAYLTVSYTYSSGMALSLSLGEGYGNPYLEQDGTLNYMCNIARLNRLCKVKYRDDSTLGGVESYIYSYDGINQFVFTNFMDSGVDVTFTIDTSHTGADFDPENLRTLSGDFVPIDNIYYDGGGWYLYNEEEEDYPAWTPTGWGKTVYYYYFYGYSEDYGYSYSFIDFSNTMYSRFYASLFFFDEDMEDSASPTIYYTLDFTSVNE